MMAPTRMLTSCYLQVALVIHHNGFEIKPIHLFQKIAIFISNSYYNNCRRTLFSIFQLTTDGDLHGRRDGYVRIEVGREGDVTTGFVDVDQFRTVARHHSIV